jgi:lysophospholipase L1-like esterase
MFLSLIALLTVLSAQSCSAALPLKVGGRVERQADGSVRFGWPGTYFEGRFRGSGVTIVTDSKTEHLRVLIDGEDKVVLREAGTSHLSISGLPEGEHVVRLEKLSESQSSSARLVAIAAVDGVALPPPPVRTRRIEFIGDSHTVGYGNTSPVRECTRDEVHDRTDTQQAFGPLTARQFDADYRIHAYSGFGIVRNYNGSSPGLSLPTIYDRILPGETNSYPGDSWRPQLIVINLGTNDFSTELHRGEKWTDAAALRADYRLRYAEFLRKLMKDQPQARFILMGSDGFIGELEQVQRSLRPSERDKIVTVRVTGLDLMACDWHPSLADHRALAEMVAQAIPRTGLDWSTSRDEASR